MRRWRFNVSVYISLLHPYLFCILVGQSNLLQTFQKPLQPSIRAISLALQQSYHSILIFLLLFGRNLHSSRVIDRRLIPVPSIRRLDARFPLQQREGRVRVTSLRRSL